MMSQKGTLFEHPGNNVISDQSSASLPSLPGAASMVASHSGSSMIVTSTSSSTYVMSDLTVGGVRSNFNYISNQGQGQRSAVTSTTGSASYNGAAVINSTPGLQMVEQSIGISGQPSSNSFFVPSAPPMFRPVPRRFTTNLIPTDTVTYVEMDSNGVPQILHHNPYLPPTTAMPPTYTANHQRFGNSMRTSGQAWSRPSFVPWAAPTQFNNFPVIRAPTTAVVSGCSCSGTSRSFGGVCDGQTASVTSTGNSASSVQATPFSSAQANNLQHKWRKKTVYSRKQLRALQDAFSRDVYLTAAKKKELGEQIGLTERQVIVYFDNHRQKLKINT
ncbi:uncharacterized protein LOC143460287 [Clavelina lepadiformis]|uniref:uncharacterized protein LOC143460287 n=1 Tax=Clavelina lepadiformis TaxID=159417 RepID=UPI00404284A0